jgi:hypothetical protein
MEIAPKYPRNIDKAKQNANDELLLRLAVRTPTHPADS